MKIVLFYHSLISDWNHGNAHFLRGIYTSLQNMGHKVELWEPLEGWSLQTLIADHGEGVFEDFKRNFPELKTNFYIPKAHGLSEILMDADLVIVHEWSDPELVSEVGRMRLLHDFTLFFHDTHHRAVSEPRAMENYDLMHYDGVLAFGDTLSRVYKNKGWHQNVRTWHEAADTSTYYPMAGKSLLGDVVWIGNWGDEERTQEIHEFIIEPVKRLNLKAKFYGVRYPKHAIKSLESAGIEYGGYLPTSKAPEVFSQYKATIHVPRRFYRENLHGIPTIRPFEAMASGIPLLSAPWEDSENLFTEGKDFLMAYSGEEMTTLLQKVITENDFAKKMAENALKTILSKHTCDHRARDLMAIYDQLQATKKKKKEFAMMKGLNIVFFGSSLVSAYWNGAATYYRGIIKIMHQQGHSITFFEPDVYDRQANRDIPDPEYARVIIYKPSLTALQECLDSVENADILIKASGVGIFDKEIEVALLENRKDHQQVIFWDVDAPATLDRMLQNDSDYFRFLVPKFDQILTYGGGQPVESLYHQLGARKCESIYNAFDPDTHFPVLPSESFVCDLAFLGNRLPDREKRVEKFFIEVAAALPELKFILGGSGWTGKYLPENIEYIGHVPTAQHNELNCSAKAILNISRDSMATYGFSPATRVFEAAGVGACIITDAWEGISHFFEPNNEILVADSSQQVVEILSTLDQNKARQIGDAAYKKAIQFHTYAHRANQLERILHPKEKIL